MENHPVPKEHVTTSVLVGGRYDGWSLDHDRDDAFILLDIPEKWNLPSYVLVYQKDRIIPNRFNFLKYIKRDKVRNKITKQPIPKRGK